MSFGHDCIFCKIVQGKIPSEKIYEDEKVIAFRDVAPAAPIHYLFIPKEHWDSLAQVKTEEIEIMAHLFRAISAVTREKGIAEDGFRTVINTGIKGGQSVFHLHVHVLAGQNMSPKMS